MKGFGTEDCTGGKKVIGNDLGKVPNPQAPKIQWNESPKESTQVQQVRTALGDQLEPPKIWGWDEGKTTLYFCSFTITLSALCWKCVSVSHRTTAHKRRGKKENLHWLGFCDQLIPWPLIPVNFNRLMPPQCYLSFMGWSDFIRLFLSVKGLTKVMVISLNRILMVIISSEKAAGCAGNFHPSFVSGSHGTRAVFCDISERNVNKSTSLKGHISNVTTF